ncbi:hypothetical protein Goshw_010984 [Gossypium schwendimanii]|uniref:Uncharacterized protein n=1 Tax=Gossypium schwendimanii TaxID=34291 RepID=A0A7J9KKL2_GOSSC|nr:hypothetical protein [Gossypium schwendimanii]
MEDVIKYLTRGRGSWNYRPDTELHTNFNQPTMFLVAKMWMQFIGTRLAPALNVSNVNVFQAETGPVLQEFTKMNELRTLNYPSNMFRSTLTHQDEGANLEKEGAAQDPTRYAHSMGGNFYQTYVKGKGKAPMEMRQRPNWDDEEND